MGSDNPTPKASGLPEDKKDFQRKDEDLSDKQLESLKRSICKQLPDISFVGKGKSRRH